MGLSAATLQQIGTTLARFPQVEKGVLYGSRAKGNFKPCSDIDLTLRGDGLTLSLLSDIDMALDDLLLPYEIGLPNWSPILTGLIGLIGRFTREDEPLRLVCRRSFRRVQKSIDNSYPNLYTMTVKSIYTTDQFDMWFGALRDKQAARRIQARIDRIEEGNFGDCKPVGEGVSEIRVHFGPGYRVYFAQRRLEIVILLAGGDKSSQDKDIKTAIGLAKQLQE